jgi:hypothetical protein
VTRRHAIKSLIAGSAAVALIPLAAKYDGISVYRVEGQEVFGCHDARGGFETGRCFFLTATARGKEYVQRFPVPAGCREVPSGKLRAAKAEFAEFLRGVE